MKLTSASTSQTSVRGGTTISRFARSDVFFSFVHHPQDVPPPTRDIRIRLPHHGDGSALHACLQMDSWKAVFVLWVVFSKTPVLVC